MLTIAICEDNTITAQEIRQKIGKHCPVPAEILCFSDSFDLFQAIKKKENIPDIVFMDIELKTISGIQAAKDITALLPECQIIFITNYVDYVSDVYAASHTYFILKKQMDRYLSDALTKSIRKLQELRQFHLIIQSGKDTVRLQQTDILYMERILRSTEIHTADRVFKCTEKLNSLHGRLTDWFAFSHRSFLVNCRHIVTYNHQFCTLSDGSEIPISRTYYPAIQEGFSKSF